MDWPTSFAQYGLLGLVLAGAGAGLYHLAMVLLKPISDAQVRTLNETAETMRELRGGLPIIMTTADELRKFREESKDPKQPYSALICRQQNVLLARLLCEDREERRAELVNEIREIAK